MMMELMTRLWPLHRTLVSDGTDRALEIIGEYLPQEFPYAIHGHPSGQKIWTWTVPQRFVVDEATLDLLEPGGPRRLIDFCDNPLHVVSYSLPFEGEIGFDQLSPHLHASKERPQAIPWVFKFYARDWGLCLSQDMFDAMPRDGRYKVTIRTRFENDRLKVGDFTIPGQTDDFFLIVCDVCHPSQVNDSLSGVVVAVDFVRRLAAGTVDGRLPGPYGIKVLFLPETIGSIAHFANNENLIDRCKFAVFSEFLGNDDRIRLQRTRQDDHLLDRTARMVLKKRTRGDFIEGPFCHTIITNDEKVTNAPGVDIPTIALNRWPDGGWPLYHTTDDRPAAMNPEKLAEVSEIYDDLFTMLQTNFYPRRTFRGPLFLSGVKMDFDWLQSRPVKRAVQDLASMLEGDLSVIDIAERTGLDYDLARKILEAMRRQGLVTVSHIPATDS